MCGAQEGAQKCVTAYLKSVFLAPNKAVFDLGKLPVGEFAFSMGLSAPPKLRFVKKSGKKLQEVGSSQCFLFLCHSGNQRVIRSARVESLWYIR